MVFPLNVVAFALGHVNAVSTTDVDGCVIVEDIVDEELRVEDETAGPPMPTSTDAVLCRAILEETDIGSAEEEACVSGTW